MSQSSVKTSYRITSKYLFHLDICHLDVALFVAVGIDSFYWFDVNYKGFIYKAFASLVRIFVSKKPIVAETSNF